jgi:hypothetical protein
MLDYFLQTPKVQDWQSDLAVRMREWIERTYASKPNEVECVRAMVNAIDNMEPVTVMIDNIASFELRVESAFLHGSRSQVRFKVGGSEHQRELADLLVLASYVEDGRLEFQRACLIQAKRSGQSTSNGAFRYPVDPWQLALLASFPEFRGVSGVFAGLKVHLRNWSGMLGAYGFLSPPGEILIVSARVLNQVLGGRNSIAAQELVPAILSESAASRSFVHVPREHFWLDPEHCPYCREAAMNLFYPHWLSFFHAGRHQLPPSATVNSPRESVTTCIALDEFVQCWTGFRLGEVWQSRGGGRSHHVLRAFLHAAISRVHSATGKLTGVRELLDRESAGDNLRFDDENPEWCDGGLRVVSAIGTIEHKEG